MLKQVGAVENPYIIPHLPMHMQDLQWSHLYSVNALV